MPRVAIGVPQSRCGTRKLRASPGAMPGHVFPFCIFPLDRFARRAYKGATERDLARPNRD